MLILGGYLLTYDQLHQLGLRRGILLENGDPNPLNHFFEEKDIGIYAWPVSHPRGSPTRQGVPGTLIVTRQRDDNLERLADCKPFAENEDDLKVKKWLENHGLWNIPFVAVPDPNMKYNEYGAVYD